MDHHRHSATETDSVDALAELLDLDAEVFGSYLSAAIAWVKSLAPNLPRPRILDLGSGTGSATVALAQRFDGAQVLAVDQSAELLARVSARAADLGLAGRVDTLQADLDGPWPVTGAVDVVWASMSLHHLAGPDRVLAGVFASIRPGGLFAVAEMDSLPRFLPDDIGLGRPGLEARCHAAAAERQAHELPHLGADWGQRLSQAGFTVVAKRAFAIDLDPPLPASAGRLAQLWLRRIRAHLDGAIGAEDLATLGALTDDGPGGVLRRGDLSVRGTRTIWIGKRP
jgi:SAM-dependent methyltransferase